MCKRILAALLTLCLLSLPVYALEDAAPHGTPEATVPQDTTAPTEATEVPEKAVAQQVTVTVSGTGYKTYDFLTDGREFANRTSGKDCVLTVKAKTPFQSLYVQFDLECEPYTITDDVSGESIDAGQYGMLHEYVTLPQSTTQATLRFTGSVQVSEISAYSPGQPPENVQVWEAPLDNKADILLLSTHGDDEHLFFAGLFPLYAAERGLRVQVAYMTSHRNTPTTPHRTLPSIRCHEMLNGLWATGVRNYPVFGPFIDFLIEDMEGSYRHYEQEGVTREDLLGYVVEQIRRFKPQVVIGHDFNGEYGHGMHMVYADLLAKALPITNDPTAYPQLAEQYGLWDVPKTYFHLYEENPIVIDYDVPLESFHGMTAFQVSQNYGFPCHESQQIPRFTIWLYGSYKQITKATQIVKYNPAHFGLYRSLVGEDVLKNDFMENLTSYQEQERIEAERLEAERLEKERLEAERLEKERLEKERLEKERLEKELEQQRQLEAQKLQQQKKRQLILIWGTAALAVALGLLFIFLRKKKF